MRSYRPTQRAHICAYCTGKVHIIDSLAYPNDVNAKRDCHGKWICGDCQEEEVKDLIVRVTPNSQRAREIVAEDREEVRRYNDNAQRLNKSAGIELMKLKRNKYGSQ